MGKEIGVEANHSLALLFREGILQAGGHFPWRSGSMWMLGILSSHFLDGPERKSPRGLTHQVTALSPSFLAQCWPRLQLLLWAPPPPPTTPSKAVVSGV